MEGTQRACHVDVARVDPLGALRKRRLFPRRLSTAASAHITSGINIKFHTMSAISLPLLPPSLPLPPSSTTSAFRRPGTVRSSTFQPNLSNSVLQGGIGRVDRANSSFLIYRVNQFFFSFLYKQDELYRGYL